MFFILQRNVVKFDKRKTFCCKYAICPLSVDIKNQFYESLYRLQMVASGELIGFNNRYYSPFDSCRVKN